MNLPMKDGGRCTSRQNPPTHSVLRSGARKAANALGSASAVWAPKKLRRPAAWAVVNALRNSRRNRRESTRTGRKKPGRQDTQRELSGEIPPPGTIMCTCGWWVSAEPQVCSTEVMPIRAPRWIGGDRQHRLGRELEQEIVDHGLVLVGDIGD